MLKILSMLSIIFLIYDFLKCLVFVVKLNDFRFSDVILREVAQNLTISVFEKIGRLLST